jgi:hypothetical protein
LEIKNKQGSHAFASLKATIHDTFLLSRRIRFLSACILSLYSQGVISRLIVVKGTVEGI